jgi:YjbE family integral membrane protein
VSLLWRAISSHDERTNETLKRSNLAFRLAALSKGNTASRYGARLPRNDGNACVLETLYAAAPRFLEIMWLNIVLSGDNAVVIGLAAAGLPAHQRARAVMFGIVAAAVLRIVFSIFATYLLGIWWVAFIGGAALLYIAWGFYRELRGGGHGEEDDGGEAKEKSLGQALWQIVVADVSMSLDNVLAVAAVARNDMVMLVVGLSISIVLMGLLGGFLARILDRYKIIAYIGVALIAYIGIELIWEGVIEGNAALNLGLPIHAPVHHAPLDAPPPAAH